MVAEGPDISGTYYPTENDLTGGLPINLDSLRDGPPGSKPFYPYSTLIRFVLCSVVVCFMSFVCSCHLFSYAIKGSPNQKLLLAEIYYAIESRVRPARPSLLLFHLIFRPPVFLISEQPPMAGRRVVFCALYTVLPC